MRGFTPFGRENAALSWRFDDNWLYLFWFSTGDRETRRETRTQAMCGPLAPMPVSGKKPNPKFRFLLSIQTLFDQQT